MKKNRKTRRMGPSAKIYDENDPDCRGSISEMTSATENPSVTEFKPKIKWVNLVSIAVIHVLAAYTFYAKLPQVALLTILWDCRGSTSKMTCATENPSVTKFKPKIKWVNLVSIAVIHVLAAYTFYEKLPQVALLTILWGFILGQMGGFGVTGGAHRLWTHRSYKANLQLRIILAICYAIAGQNKLRDWVRDHRVHHKFSETDADPHNSKRGFFFSHVGWLLQTKHPEVIRRGREINMSDVMEDPVVRFHDKYFWLLKVLLCFGIPIAVPVYLWNESWLNSFLGIGCARLCLGLNFTWFVNSAAHIWGNKPYNRDIRPAENWWVSILAMGEGWHNYHHSYPHDYRAAELGGYSMNFTTFLIDMFAKLGWAYDLRTAPPEAVRRMVENRGDGSHAVFGHHHHHDDHQEHHWDHQEYHQEHHGDHQEYYQEHHGDHQEYHQDHHGDHQEHHGDHQECYQEHHGDHQEYHQEQHKDHHQENHKDFKDHYEDYYYDYDDVTSEKSE